MRKSGYKQIRQVTREEMKEYGEFFKSMRKSVNMTLAEMAEEIGTDRCTFSRWERGMSIPNIEIESLVDMVRQVIKKRRS